MLGRQKARLLAHSERDAALAFLKREARQNLLLMELVTGVGHPPSLSELAPRVVAVWRGGEICGLAALRPSIVLDHEMDEAVLSSCLPFVDSVESGLIKSGAEIAGALWDWLSRRGREALIDRGESTYLLPRERFDRESSAVEPPLLFRTAELSDLDALVFAARASLREEGRPDPFSGDPHGFRRWVRGRVPRARVIESERRVVFVGYADVRRSEGWLVQGVYTWPEVRRRGHAAAGMRGLIAEAVEDGTDHVQLAVVEGNEPAIRLYESLGFEPLTDLRTILFV